MTNFMKQVFKDGDPKPLIKAAAHGIGWLAAFAIVGSILYGIFHMEKVQAQTQQLTACTNGKAVIYVTNFTCPPGYWRYQG